MIQGRYCALYIELELNSGQVLGSTHTNGVSVGKPHVFPFPSWVSLSCPMENSVMGWWREGDELIAVHVID